MPDSWRETLANSYLRGTGLEIGALHNPLRVPPEARVCYVDRMPVAQLREHYPELAAQDLVPVDVIDDGERLGAIADASQDFLVANHFLEHCEDPIGTLQSHLRVLRSGGVLYLAIPDKRTTFDKLRPVTPLEHLLRDHAHGPSCSRQAHFAEWAKLVWAPMAGVREEQAIAAEAERLQAMDYSIHYHVWTEREFLELLLHVQKRTGCVIEACVRNSFAVMVECIAVLRKA